MKLTSQEEYGLRCILTLARQDTPGEDKASLTLAQIAESECLSSEYAGKLMGILTRAGLVESVRGRNGGYRLTRMPESIRVADVLGALGSRLYRKSKTCDRFSGDQEFCIHSSACSIRSLWAGLQLLIDHVLTRTTLQDLVSIEEKNITGWMMSHLEALSGLEPLGAAAPSMERSNVVLRQPEA